MIAALTTNPATLVLASPGPALETLVGFSSSSVLLWAHGNERRLYGHAPDATTQLWDGDDDDPRRYAARMNAEFRPYDRFDEDLTAALPALDEIQLPFGDAALSARVLSLVGRKRRFRRGDIALRDLRDAVGARRLCKSPDEIACLREACRRSAEAHVALMRTHWIGRTERDVAMRFDLELRQRSIAKTAYETIVGAGPRATVLHARATDRVITDGELILIDAGGVWGGHCADITRTIPAGKSFSPAQAELHAIVLEAQQNAIAMVRPGATLDALHARARTSLTDGLRARGWLPNGFDEIPAHWFPHQTSHWIGREVHDPCPYREADGSPIVLAPGMVFTIEPGIYLRGDDAPAEICGLGVRIEDVVLVTETGAEVLTAAAPKERSAIEALRRDSA